MFRKNEAGLQTQVDGALQALRADGTLARIGSRSPPCAAAITSRKPGPPSESGSTSTSSSGALDCHPRRIAVAASVAVNVPANLSGATRTRMSTEC